MRKPKSASSGDVEKGTPKTKAVFRRTGEVFRPEQKTERNSG